METSASLDSNYNYHGLILQTFMFARVNLVIHHELIGPPRGFQILIDFLGAWDGKIAAAY
jgi:hypothetical protein